MPSAATGLNLAAQRLDDFPAFCACIMRRRQRSAQPGDAGHPAQQRAELAPGVITVSAAPPQAARLNERVGIGRHWDDTELEQLLAPKVDSRGTRLVVGKLAKNRRNQL
jgi:hypothetical protein